MIVQPRLYSDKTEEEEEEVGEVEMSFSSKYYFQGIVSFFRIVFPKRYPPTGCGFFCSVKMIFNSRVKLLHITTASS